jgi:hypothetical protein
MLNNGQVYVYRTYCIIIFFVCFDSGSSLSTLSGLNMSSLTDKPTEDPHSSEHLIALQLLQEQMWKTNQQRQRPVFQLYSGRVQVQHGNNLID